MLIFQIQNSSSTAFRGKNFKLQNIKHNAIKDDHLNNDFDLNDDLNDDFVNDDFHFNVIDLNDLYIVAVWMEPSLSACSISR